MKATLSGIGAAALALIVLQTVVTSSETSNLASLAAQPAKWAAAWMDPTVPLIPDLTGATSAATKPRPAAKPGPRSGEAPAGLAAELAALGKPPATSHG